MIFEDHLQQHIQIGTSQVEGTSCGPAPQVLLEKYMVSNRFGWKSIQSIYLP